MNVTMTSAFNSLYYLRKLHLTFCLQRRLEGVVTVVDMESEIWLKPRVYRKIGEECWTVTLSAVLG